MKDRIYNKRKEITKTWISGIPKAVVQEYGLDSSSHVIVERTENDLYEKKSQKWFPILSKESEN